jgi:hypothetical protein
MFGTLVFCIKFDLFQRERPVIDWAFVGNFDFLRRHIQYCGRRTYNHMCRKGKNFLGHCTFKVRTLFL